ncbi:SurA N-terminal domain-containing protein [Actinomadura sp. ATCC 31491]|uniref:SurA N-terminal domain-containing protein n=1 Tax=Actinomadura luzonensis TaxID=2805427 RepID=A0ABT0FLJ3_9ACTN|nr:SurA N-terminal domain-containing protein [Actinomadura luzonensis]MCK2213206.1 SurA N-terminal domain-containing protein [Actinomadura luzonensis]
MKSIRVAVAAAAAGLALTACSSPSHIGAAAVVGDQRITVSEVNADAEAYKAALKRNNLSEADLGGVPVSHVVLQRLLNVAITEQLLDRYKVQVSETEIDAAIKDPGQFQSAEINLLSQGVVPSDARDYGRAMVGLSKLQQQFGGESGNQRLAQEFNSVKPVINPRYGALNPQRTQENPGPFIDPGRFGKPAATPQQTAQG